MHESTLGQKTSRGHSSLKDPKFAISGMLKVSTLHEKTVKSCILKWSPLQTVKGLSYHYNSMDYVGLTTSNCPSVLAVNKADKLF